MKKFLLFVAALALIFTLTACSMGNSAIKQALNHTPENIQESPDKYTWYVKDYVGKNAASFGEYDTGKKSYYDTYGDGEIYFTFVSDDGSFVSKNNISEYIVTGQSPAPNTEIKYQYYKFDDGTEGSWVDTQNIESIELKVTKVDTESGQTNTAKSKQNDEKISSDANAKPKVDHTPQPINVSPDKYTWYVKDYVGRNLATIGYYSLGNDLRDRYGEGNIKLIVITDDGSAVDLSDEEELKKYIVSGQGIVPNSEIKYTFLKQSDGTEYDNLIDTQNVDAIDLYVTKISN